MKKITVTKKTTAKVVGGLAKYIVLIFIFAFLLFPVYWMLVTALKTNIESYRLVPTLWPETISLDGFKTLISDGKFLVYYNYCICDGSSNYMFYLSICRICA